MILVRVGEHEAEQIAALLDQEADVRQDEIDARQVLAARTRRRDRPRSIAAGARRRGRRARGSCRSRRPRRAAQIPVRRPGGHQPYALRVAASVMRACRAGHDVAGRDQLLAPSGQSSTRRPASSSAFEAAGELAIGEPHADDLAEAGRAREPVGADGREAARRRATAPAGPSILARERREQRLRRDDRAGRGEIGRRDSRSSAGWPVQLTPMPMATTLPPRPCPRLRSGCRRTSRRRQQQIVRPFDRQPRLERRRRPRRPRRGPRAPRRTRAPANARPAPDRSAAGSRADCRAPRSRCGRAGRARRSAARP